MLLWRRTRKTPWNGLDPGCFQCPTPGQLIDQGIDSQTLAPSARFGQQILHAFRISVFAFHQRQCQNGIGLVSEGRCQLGINRPCLVAIAVESIQISEKQTKWETGLRWNARDALFNILDCSSAPPRLLLD